ncbi:lytic transglycosylase [Streptomyces sp. NPDC021098]|uniref:transglycosylase SLT domain-containing protein n=1 Tax=unclassified Streptomyces TaxID=2593676 RepID=UPI0037AA379D
MPLPSIPGYNRLTKTTKYSAAGIAAAGAAAIAFALVPGGNADAKSTAQELPAKPVSWNSQKVDSKAQQEILLKQATLASKQAQAEAAQKKAAEAAAAKKAAEAAAAKKAAAEAAAKKAAAAQAAKERAAKEAASRAAARAKLAAAKKTYPNNLDGWIRESLDIMKKHNIPGTYHGIYKNVIRESGGDPRAINNYDINAQNGVPSKGLLQVILPTFQAYHVPGTPFDQYDPVANIVAACNYAADRYGSIDNVNGPY